MGTNSISQPLKRQPGTAPARPVVTVVPAQLRDAGFTFEISTGRLYGNDGMLVAAGLFSGHGLGMNNPDMQALRGVGPLPEGIYRVGPLVDGGHLGPNVMHLTQTFGASYGRSGFFIHGASALHPLTSSDGCIIASPTTRERIDAQIGPARLLKVTR